MPTRTNPLVRGYTRASIGANVSREMHRGKPQDQAVAIALDTARRAYRARHPRGRLPAQLRRNPAMPANPSLRLSVPGEPYVRRGFTLPGMNLREWSDQFRALGGTRAYIRHQRYGRGLMVEADGTPEALAFVKRTARNLRRNPAMRNPTFRVHVQTFGEREPGRMSRQMGAWHRVVEAPDVESAKREALREWHFPPSWLVGKVKAQRANPSDIARIRVSGLGGPSLVWLTSYLQDRGVAAYGTGRTMRGGAYVDVPAADKARTGQLIRQYRVDWRAGRVMPRISPEQHREANPDAEAREFRRRARMPAAEREALERAELAAFRDSPAFRSMMRRREQMAAAGPYGRRRRNPDTSALPKLAALGVFAWAVFELVQPILHGATAHAANAPASSGGGGGGGSGWTQLTLTDTGGVPLEWLGSRVRQSAAWIAQFCAGCPQNEYHPGAVFADGNGNTWLWQGSDVLQGPDVPGNDLSQQRRFEDFT